MKAAEEIGILCRVATARMPTKWGMFNVAGFERAAKRNAQIDTALAIIMGDLRGEAPLLRMHSQCFTGEGLGSLRCDCSDQNPYSLPNLRTKKERMDHALSLPYCDDTGRLKDLRRWKRIKTPPTLRTPRFEFDQQEI